MTADLHWPNTTPDLGPHLWPGALPALVAELRQPPTRAERALALLTQRAHGRPGAALDTATVRAAARILNDRDSR